MNESVKFLKNLAQELKDQPTDCQAAPRFWVIKDYRWIPGNPEYDNCEVSYFHSDGDFTEFKNVEELEGFLEEHYNLSQHFRNDFDDNDYDFEKLWEWSLENLNEDGYFAEAPIKKESYIVPDTMFLTKADAVNHLKENAHHYTSDAHIYAMTAWRSPTVERLLNIIETFDWESITNKGEQK